jgi:hypothetical protein
VAGWRGVRRKTVQDHHASYREQGSLLKRLVGHVDGSITFGVYGCRLPLEAMLNAIRGLDLNITQ